MSIKYKGQSFLGFQEHIEFNTGSGFDGSSTPSYAHPVDKQIINTLNSSAIKVVINKAIDALVSFQFGYDLVNGIVIDQHSFPELFRILSHCSKTLGIPIPHAVAEHREDALLNAFTAGTDEYAFIVISSALCDVMSDEEICFVIGHECGHIAASHAAYHTLVQVLTGAIGNNFGLIGNLLRATAGIPLMAWSRRSEITADRAGLLCCGDIITAQKSLLRLVTGLADIENVDIDAYLQRAKVVEEFHAIPTKLGELFASHPQIPKRIKALRLFADSELYYSLSKKTKPVGKTLLSQEQLNRQVNQLVQP